MLSEWNAVGFREIMLGGRTKPLVIECQRVMSPTLSTDAPSLPERREFLVKALGNPEVDNALIIKELLGNILARAYGLTTPEPALIYISEPFTNAVNPILRRNGHQFQIAPGPAAGCEYFRGGFHPPTSSMSKEEVAPLAALYGFDLVFQNPDRMPERPNCGMLGKKLVAFDFDQCFSFLYLIGSFGEPWEVSKHGIGPKHIAFTKLKNSREPVLWEDNVNAVFRLSNDVLESLTSWIPDDWGSNSKKIQDHLAGIREHLGKFELELHRSIQ